MNLSLSGSFLATAVLFASLSLHAQKGIPAKQVVNINHTTNYPQHIDFKPVMVKQLKVPAGWEVMAAATGLGKPRMLLAGRNGELYVTRRDAGDVLLLKDVNGDNKFEEMITVVADFKGVHGIAMKDNQMYLCNNRELKRFPILADGKLGAEELIFNDLPDGGQHGNRTMAFGPDGLLYLSVGSTCNDCNETNKENATMLVIDVVNKTRSIYARGLRNTIGFDWDRNGQLYGVDNGGDAKGEDWPPEELNMISKDKDYGWPLVYAKREVDQTREDPVGTTKEAYAKTTEPSLFEFPAHSAPIAFSFMKNASTLAPTEQDDALVCWHGSWNRRNPDGFKVQQIIFENGKPVGTRDFLSGFLSADKRSRFGRPAGLVVTPEGAVYISDDANGVIYCVKKISNK